MTQEEKKVQELLKPRYIVEDEWFDCPNCSGECYIADSTVTPSGVQKFTYQCTDCNEEWSESY